MSLVSRASSRRRTSSAMPPLRTQRPGLGALQTRDDPLEDHPSAEPVEADPARV